MEKIIYSLITCVFYILGLLLNAVILYLLLPIVGFTFTYLQCICIVMIANVLLNPIKFNYENSSN